MVYALINGKNEVLEISDSLIENTNPNLSVVQIPDFQEGDEVNFYIVINEVNEQGEVTSYSAVRYTPAIQTMMQENVFLRNKITELEANLQIAKNTIDFLLGV